MFQFYEMNDILQEICIFYDDNQAWAKRFKTYKQTFQNWRFHIRKSRGLHSVF